MPYRRWSTPARKPRITLGTSRQASRLQRLITRNPMTSDARSEAARRNGAKSNGPKTPEGKATSSMNALRHGMTAKGILLTNENPEAFHKLAGAYYEKFEPADDVERDLV